MFQSNVGLIAELKAKDLKAMGVWHVWSIAGGDSHLCLAPQSALLRWRA